jgi:hypothetical protein
LNIRLNPRALVSTLAKELVKEYAPDFVAGVLEDQAKGKTVAQFYEYMEHGIWNSLSPGEKQFALNQKPWDLNWLNLEFIINAIAGSNETIACLITSSPELQKKIQAEIDLIKQELC